MWSVPRCRGVRDARHVVEKLVGGVGAEVRALELFLRVITVSLETMKIVKGLPTLEILES